MCRRTVSSRRRSATFCQVKHNTNGINKLNITNKLNSYRLYYKISIMHLQNHRRQLQEVVQGSPTLSHGNLSHLSVYIHNLLLVWRVIINQGGRGGRDLGMSMTPFCIPLYEKKLTGPCTMVSIYAAVFLRFWLLM